MTALKKISKVICVCKYGVQQMGKALSQKGFYEKGTLDQRGSRKYKVPKLEMALLSTILVITKLGLFYPQSVSVIFTCMILTLCCGLYYCLPELEVF